MARGSDNVKIIYGTARSNPQTWYFQGTPDSRLKLGGNKGSFTKNSDGSYTLSQNDRVFLAIETNDNSGVVGTDQSTSSARGFMRNYHDWKNIEAHAYFFVEPDNPFDSAITFGAHGGNPESTFNNICIGTGYQAQFYKSGKNRFGKAIHYPSGHYYQDFKSNILDIGGRWIGFKIVIIVVSPGKVKLETYVDEGNVTNNWLPLNSYTDTGGWGGQGGDEDTLTSLVNVCGGKTDQVMDMGGPVVWWKWDNFPSGVRIKNLAVREINPAASYNDPTVQKASGVGSQKPAFGEQPIIDSPFYPDSQNFATEDRPGT